MLGSFSNPKGYALKPLSPELKRLSNFIAKFDERLVNEMVNLINGHDMIVFSAMAHRFTASGILPTNCGLL
jgi:hypothetical protein